MAVNYNLLEEFEIEGVWWLNDIPDEKLYGVLKFSPGELIELKLSGAYNEIKMHRKRKERYTIHGFTSKGKLVSIFDSHNSNFTDHHPGLSLSSFSSTRFIIGGHFNNESEISIKSISCKLTNLEEWTGISGIIFNDDFEHSFELKYTWPESIKIFSNGNFDIWLDFGTESYTVNFDFQKNFEVKQYAEIRIEYKVEESIIQALDHIRKICLFLTLIITQTIHVKSINVINISNEYCKKKYEKYKEKLIYVNVQSHISQKRKIVDEHNMLLSYHRESKNIFKMFEKWFESIELLEPVFDLYFATEFNNEYYTNDVFLNLVQAIESYHRRIYSGLELPKAEHDNRINTVMSGVPDKYQTWVKEKLHYSNELTLRKRLKILFLEYKELFLPYISNINKFANKVTDTRNYFTHFDDSLKNSVFRGIQLHHASKKLKILLIACFLKEIGLDKESIVKILKENHSLSFFIRQEINV